MIRKLLILLFFIFSSPLFFAQTGLNFIDKDQKKEKVRFKLINNLVVIPLEINGKELSFILDTGVNKTILFSLEENDSVGLKNVEKINLQGLGEGKPVDALIARNNTLKIKDIASFDETIYVILNDRFNFSAKMGITIHGIIGYSVFKNFIVNINYNSKTLVFHNPKRFKYRKCRKCETLPLRFFRRKPYVNALVQLDTIGSKKTEVKLLIDSGGSDAIWLFENSKEEIVTPKKYFKDVLGEGLSGTIFGQRSRIPSFSLGNFEFDEPTVSFLDETSSEKAQRFKQRNGSIGANILRRFNVWIDYQNKKIRLKKNRYFNDSFNYNMSGLSVVYDGQQLVKESFNEITRDSYNKQVDANNKFSLVQRYKYLFKNSYKIERVVPNSSAAKAGLKVDDKLVKINSKRAYEYKLSDIISLFQSRENKTITIIVDRNGEELKFKFKLEKRI